MLNNVNRRDRDFLRAVRREAGRRGADGRPLTVREAVRRAVASPAPSYYVSTDYAWRMVRDDGAPKRLRRSRKSQMWEELRARYESELARNPGKDPYIVLDQLLKSGNAPRFFIAESSALSLYFKILTNQRKEPK